MPYDQVEAKLRFDGLLGLWQRLHDRVSGQRLTLEEYTELATEGKHLVDAYNEETERYMKAFGHERVYEPTIEVLVKLQRIIMCTGAHLIEAKIKLDDIMNGKMAFTEMLGTSPASKQKVWN